MIRTMMGGTVEVLSAEAEDEYGVVWVQVRRSDGSQREYALHELRADNGIQEIFAAIAAANTTEVQR